MNKETEIIVQPKVVRIRRHPVLPSWSLELQHLATQRPVLQQLAEVIDMLVRHHSLSDRLLTTEA